MANTIKKGSKVILKAFTGMKLGVKEVTAADKNTITIATDDGRELVFDRKTLKQIDPEPKAPRFANSIMEDDGSYVPPQRKKKAKPAPKKAAKKAKPEPEDEEEDEEEETPAPKKTKKAPAKKAAPKKKPEPVEEDDDDDFDDDDFDDDDFEEVE